MEGAVGKGNHPFIGTSMETIGISVEDCWSAFGRSLENRWKNLRKAIRGACLQVLKVAGRREEDGKKMAGRGDKGSWMLVERWRKLAGRWTNPRLTGLANEGV
jgi:hypothetical protein